MSGVPKVYPALAQSQEIQDRAARVGFDWETIDPVIQKVYEELDEVKSAETPEERAKELGDVLFAMVNVVRWYNVDAETVLRETNQRFRNRFNFIEEKINRDGKKFRDCSFEELDLIWEEAKQAGL